MKAGDIDGQTDEGIRELYRESALRTDMEWFTVRLRGRLAAERPARPAAQARRLPGGPPGWWSRLRDRPWRLVLVALAAVAVLGGATVGVYEAVEHVRRQTPVLVIDDDSMLGSTGAASAYDAVLPPGVSGVVGTSFSSLWCLSRELGFTTVDVGAPPLYTATGTTGNLVAYTTEQSGGGDIFVWDAAETGADEAVTQLAVGDASDTIALLSMSPDGTKLAVGRTPSLTNDYSAWDSPVGHLYIVDLATGAASEWQWPEWPEVGALLVKTGREAFAWSPTSDAFYVSFATLLVDSFSTTDGPTFRCELATGASTELGGLKSVEDVDANARGDVVWIVLDGGPMGMLSSAYPEASVAILQHGQLTTVEPATQQTFGPLFISADGESLVLQGDSDDDEWVWRNVLEVIRRSDEGWASARVIAPESLPYLNSFGFAGGDRFYFAGRVDGRDGLTRWQLGELDPVSGEYQMYEELPSRDGSGAVGLWTQPSTPDDTPDETPEDTGTTTSTTEPSSPDAPVTSTADLPLTEVKGTTVFNAVDTIAGTCVKDLVENGRVSEELSLTDAELQELYRGLLEMDVLSYPSYFQPDTDGTAVEGGSDYYLEIQIGDGVVTFLQWQDLFASSLPRAVALRDWFSTMQGVIEAKPEWQVLPPAVGVHDG